MSIRFAQVNIAMAKYPMDDPRMADFVKNTERINALADKSPGFYWRWIEEPSNDVLKIFGSPSIVVNMSIWETKAALLDFTYKSGHAEIYKRRDEWFSKMQTPHMACWYTADSALSLLEAKNRLSHLDQHGETAFSFSFRSNFTAEEAKEFL